VSAVFGQSAQRKTRTARSCEEAGSSGAALIVLQHAAESLSTFDLAGNRADVELQGSHNLLVHLMSHDVRHSKTLNSQYEPKSPLAHHRSHRTARAL
jgi:hypothetical protein